MNKLNIFKKYSILIFKVLLLLILPVINIIYIFYYILWPNSKSTSILYNEFVLIGLPIILTLGWLFVLFSLIKDAKKFTKSKFTKFLWILFGSILLVINFLFGFQGDIIFISILIATPIIIVFWIKKELSPPMNLNKK